MKKLKENWMIIIPISMMLLMMFAVLGGVNSITSAHDDGVSFRQYNWPSPEPNYKLPKTWKINYNSITNEYILACNDDPGLKEFTTYLELYHGGGPFVLGIWKFSEQGDAARFKDTSILKAYAHMLYNNIIRDVNKNKFNPIKK